MTKIRAIYERNTGRTIVFMRKMKKGETALEGLMLSYNFNKADLLENAGMMESNTNHEWDGPNMQRMGYKQEGLLKSYG